jgi:hypothetical protein
MTDAFRPTPVPPLTAAPLYLRATLRSVVWRSHSRFHETTDSAILAGCAAHPEHIRQAQLRGDGRNRKRRLPIGMIRLVSQQGF